MYKIKFGFLLLICFYYGEGSAEILEGERKSYFSPLQK